jgi:hypothetical protein
MTKTSEMAETLEWETVDKRLDDRVTPTTDGGKSLAA